jgi:hypothetical protein
VINGDINKFVECLFLGEELDIVFEGKTYLMEGGYDENKVAEMFVEEYDNNNHENDHVIFETTSTKDLKECVEKFLEAPIWNGKKFWDAEKDMEWIDG